MKSDFLTCGSNTIIGMVHCRALPSTFGFDGNYSSLIEKAVEDALTLEKSGFDAIIVENMGDVPFSAYISKTQTAALAVIAHAVKKAIRIPVGICRFQRLRGQSLHCRHDWSFLCPHSRFC